MVCYDIFWSGQLADFLFKAKTAFSIVTYGGMYLLRRKKPFSKWLVWVGGLESIDWKFKRILPTPHRPHPLSFQLIINESL